MTDAGVLAIWWPSVVSAGAGARHRARVARPSTVPCGEIQQEVAGVPTKFTTLPYGFPRCPDPEDRSPQKLSLSSIWTGTAVSMRPSMTCTGHTSVPCRHSMRPPDPSPTCLMTARTLPLPSRSSLGAANSQNGQGLF